MEVMCEGVKCVQWKRVCGPWLWRVQMDHLLCFTPGMLALGAVNAKKEVAEKYMDVAKGVRPP